MQTDVEKLGMLDLDQIDVDSEGPIKPEAKGLASEIKRSWQQSIEEEVAARTAELEAQLRSAVQVCN
jgi:hypothetical protein